MKRLVLLCLLLINVLFIQSCKDDDPAPPVYEVSTVAGSGTLGFADGTGTGASFNYPTGMVFDAAGNLFVCDTRNHCIRKITPAGEVSTFAGSTVNGNADGTGTSAQFSQPRGIVLDKAGSFYVTDAGNSNIRKITSEGVVTTIFDGDPEFKFPSAIVIDSKGDFFITDFISNVVWKLSATGGISLFAGDGSNGFADGQGQAAQISEVWGIAIDANDNLFVTNHHGVRKITPTGAVTTIAGSDAEGFADGKGSEAKFSAPRGIVLSASGDLYICDSSNHRIRRVTQGGDVLTVAGGAAGLADGVGTDAQFSSPFGMTSDANGKMYVSEIDNHTIRKIEIK